MKVRCRYSEYQGGTGSLFDFETSENRRLCPSNESIQILHACCFEGTFKPISFVVRAPAGRSQTLCCNTLTPTIHRILLLIPVLDCQAASRERRKANQEQFKDCFFIIHFHNPAAACQSLAIPARSTRSPFLSLA
jgi:hypothetical protein